ncbi:hypothetical protein NQ317_012790 [Molorchus minor]|uniref:Fibronectin type-III domain-containing protein n=1 Tax=Molorchus minor TaxID=1323400 RepID=A0ABQ9K4Q4_9CUCU|nr:hypothetical protein NQ317_012790 [Molorchus minor]
MFAVWLFIGLSFIFGASGQSGNICVSDPVTNLTLVNETIDWTIPTNCNVSFYVVNIISEDGIVYHYETENNTFDASFLPLCVEYEIRITPVSLYNVQGTSNSINGQILPGPNENFTVSAFNIISTGRTNITLEWKMPDGVERCVDLFRVVVWDDDGNNPYDVYVAENYFNLTDAVPCMQYEFGIRPIYRPEEDEPLSLFNYTSPGATTTPPVLAGIVEGITSINMTWILEPFAENRCPITAINIDASPNFNVSHPVQDDRNRLPVAFELLNLQPNTVYVSRVAVVNSNGLSEAVLLPLQTLPNSTTLN